MAKALSWLLVLALVIGIGAWIGHLRTRIRERRHAEEARVADFLAQAIARPKAAPADESLPQQKLLFEAATKAGEAGEPALAIQLFARLVARYPQGTLVAQARAAAEAQKARLAIARAPGPAGPG